MSVRTNVLWYGLAKIADRLAKVLLLPVYTRVLDREELGTAMVALAVGAFSGLLLAPGVESAYLRSMARPSTLPDTDARGPDAVAVLHAVILIAGVSFLLVFARRLAALLMPGIPVEPFYFVAVASTALTAVGAPLRAKWVAHHRAGRLALLDGASLVVSVTTTLLALLWLRWGPISILVGDLAAAIVLLPATAPTFVRLVSRGCTRDGLRYALPVVSVGLPMAAYAYALVTIDRLLLHRLSGAAEVAVYAVGYQVGAVMVVGSLIMSREWRPLVFNLAGGTRPQPAALQRLWIRSLCLFLVLGAFVALGARDLIHWGLGRDYTESAAVAAWVALIGVLRIPRVFLINLSLAHGQARDLLIESVASLAVFAAANLVLIPRYGAFGAAWAGVLAHGVGVAFLYSRRWNVYRLDRSLLPWVGVCAMGILFAAAAGETSVSSILAAAVLGLLGYEGLRYWRFLGTLRPLEAR